MNLFIVTFLFLSSVQAKNLGRPLFNSSELELLKYYKSDEYLNLQKREDLKNFAQKRVRYILKSMSKNDKEFLSNKFKKDYWKNFDYHTDKELRQKVILDLILKDLYKSEEK